MQREPETEDFRVPAGTEMTPELLQRLIDEFEQAHKPRYDIWTRPTGPLRHLRPRLAQEA